MSPASAFLAKLIKSVETDVESGKPFKLSLWRLQYPKFLSCMEAFATAPEWSDNDDKNKALNDVHDLFVNLNQAMWEQESQVWPTLKNSEPEPNTIAVVFGGKYASPALSIAETLVAILAKQSSQVYTVSRSVVVGTPSNVIHIQKTKLDEDSQGLDEFVSVLEQALKARGNSSSKISMYFTLGQHKGDNPFIRNIVAATNFAMALRKVSPELLKGGLSSFGVVLTGTDATLPSTHPDSKVTIGEDIITVPTYKISKYNFVYAMSKLCQFYILADALVDTLKGDLKEELSVELKDTIQKMKKHVIAAGEDGMYHEEDENGISMEELDNISKRSNEILQKLQGHLKVASNISICYTPLHAKPWTDMSFIKCEKDSDGSPKAYILQQIVWRLKNAISNEQAAHAHF